MTLIVAAMALTTSTRAFANYRPTGMKAIDAKLSSKSRLAPADMSQLKVLRVDGRKLHRAGRHDEAMRALGEAGKLPASGSLCPLSTSRAPPAPSD